MSKNQNILESVTARLNRSVDTIEVSIVKLMNERDKQTPHIKAVYPGLNGDEERTEELNKYFSPEIFCMGIEQRKDWINASQEEKQRCWDESIHPAMYKA